MSPDIYIESAHIGYAVLWGLELAFFYDIIAVFRNMVTHKNIFIYAEDFLYWMFCALFVFGENHICFLVGELHEKMDSSVYDIGSNTDSTFCNVYLRCHYICGILPI